MTTTKNNQRGPMQATEPATHKCQDRRKAAMPCLVFNREKNKNTLQPKERHIHFLNTTKRTRTTQPQTKPGRTTPSNIIKTRNPTQTSHRATKPPRHQTTNKPRTSRRRRICNGHLTHRPKSRGSSSSTSSGSSSSTDGGEVGSFKRQRQQATFGAWGGAHGIWGFHGYVRWFGDGRHFLIFGEIYISFGGSGPWGQPQFQGEVEGLHMPQGMAIIPSFSESQKRGLGGSLIAFGSGIAQGVGLVLLGWFPTFKFQGKPGGTSPSFARLADEIGGDTSSPHYLFLFRGLPFFRWDDCAQMVSPKAVSDSSCPAICDLIQARSFNRGPSSRQGE